MKKTIIRLVFFQCFILLSILTVLYKSAPIDLTTATQCNIVIERISYGRRYNESSLYVYNNSVEYKFSKGALATDYNSVREISEALNEGESLTITYIKDRSIFGETNLVIDAFSEKDEYLSYKQYNSEKHLVRVILIIFFCGIEIVFMTISVFVFMLNLPVKAHKKDDIRHKRN